MAVPRTLKLILVAMLLVVALAVSFLIVALLFLDDDDYRDISRRVVEDALGWTLEVKGPISLRPGLAFAITGQDAVLSRGETRLAAAELATFTLELPALLRGQFRFAVDVEEPDVRLSLDKDRATSWDFEQFAGEGGGFPLEVVIVGIRSGQGRASFRDEGSGTALDLDVDAFALREVDGQYEFAFDFASAYAGQDFRIEGTVRADSGFDTLSPDLIIARRKGAETRRSGTDPEEGTRQQPAADSVARQLSVAGEVELRADGVRVTGFKAGIGKSELTGSGMLHTEGKRPRLIADLASERLQLDEIFLSGQTEPAELEAAPPGDRTERVFSDEPIPLDWLDTLDARIRAEVKHLVVYREFTDVRYALDIDDGILELNQNLALGNGSSETRLRIDSRGSPTRFEVSEQADGVPLAFVLDLPDGVVEGGVVQGHARIAGQGSTPRAVAASLNGEALYRMGEARLIEAGLSMVSTDLLSGILESLSPSGSEEEGAGEVEYTDYRCGVFGIQIKDGMVRSKRAIALESERFNVGGDGYIDLRQETLGLAIRPKAKKGLGLSVGTLLGGFVVGGTLSSPEIQFDEAGVVVTVTVGIVVNLLRDWITVDDFSCANTLERIEKQWKAGSTEQSTDGGVTRPAGPRRKR